MPSNQSNPVEVVDSVLAPKARLEVLETEPRPPEKVFVRGVKESTLSVMLVEVFVHLTTWRRLSAKVVVPWITADTVVPSLRTVLATHRASALPWTLLTSSL